MPVRVSWAATSWLPKSTDFFISPCRFLFSGQQTNWPNTYQLRRAWELLAKLSWEDFWWLAAPHHLSQKDWLAPELKRFLAPELKRWLKGKTSRRRKRRVTTSFPGLDSLKCCQAPKTPFAKVAHRLVEAIARVDSWQVCSEDHVAPTLLTQIHRDYNWIQLNWTKNTICTMYAIFANHSSCWIFITFQGGAFQGIPETARIYCRKCEVGLKSERCKPGQH